MMEQISFGQYLANLREKRNMPIAGLASLLSMPTERVEAWEKGEALPSEANLRSLAAVFGVSLEEMTAACSNHATPVEDVKTEETTASQGENVPPQGENVPPQGGNVPPQGGNVPPQGGAYGYAPPPYGNPYGQPPYGYAPPYGNPYGQPPYGYPPYGMQPQKKGMTPTKWIAVIAGILGLLFILAMCVAIVSTDGIEDMRKTEEYTVALEWLEKQPEYKNANTKDLVLVDYYEATGMIFFYFVGQECEFTVAVRGDDVVVSESSYWLYGEFADTDMTTEAPDTSENPNFGDDPVIE